MVGSDDLPGLSPVTARDCRWASDAQERSVEPRARRGWPLPDAHPRVVPAPDEARERCAQGEARFRKEQVRKARASLPPVNVTM